MDPSGSTATYQYRVQDPKHHNIRFQQDYEFSKGETPLR